MSPRRRYALVGTGARAAMYLEAIAGPYRDAAEVVGLCDLSQQRIAWHNRRLEKRAGLAPRPAYAAADFDRMLADTRPDTVIVTTIDSTHHLYITRAMELGCDVITEKPMTTDVERMRAIFDAVDRTGRSLRVAFNYRYAPAYTALRRVMMAGSVGNPRCVDFSWLLHYIFFTKLNLVNTFYPLLLPRFFGMAFFVFMIMQFIRSIPRELDEAAELDGCSQFGIFCRIILPLIRPALVTATIFSFYWTWEDFLTPLIYLNEPKLYTISVALRSFADASGSTDWGAIFAMSALSLVPVLVVFVVFQRYRVQGISTTGMKG